MSTPPFWGVFREVFGVHSKIWALEVPFFGTWKRALLPKWWGRHLVHAFPFLGEYQANFWKLHILAPSGALFPLPRTPNLKSFSKCRLWVYNFETFFVGSGNLPAPVVKPRKRSEKKVFFWDTLLCILGKGSKIFFGKSMVFCQTGGEGGSARVMKNQTAFLKKVFFRECLESF